MSLQEKLQAETSKRRVRGVDLEVHRITSLPIRGELTPEEIEEISRLEVQAHHFNDGFRLFPSQANAIVEFDLTRGVFGPISVGDGKTLITLMIASHAYKQGIERTLLIVPEKVFDQLVLTDIPFARDRIDLCPPIHLVGKKTQLERAAITKSGRKGLYIFPYSYLSTVDSWEMLVNIRPGLIILDEAHKLKNRSSARAKRFYSFVFDYPCKLVALSGTITQKSIRDYQPLVKYALKDSSPLPLLESVADEWAAILDSGAEPSEANAGPILPVIEWARTNFPDIRFPSNGDGFRAAYSQRLCTAPGVVSSHGDGCGATLFFQNTPVPDFKTAPGYEDLDKLIKQVEEQWISPSGDEIDYAIHKWAYLNQLTAGFYYKLHWPTAEELMAKKRWSSDLATTKLALAKEHHSRLQIYHKELRNFLEHHHHTPGLDTPMLVGKRMDLYRQGKLDTLPVPDSVFEAWMDAKEFELEGLPERERDPVRVCDYKIRNAVEWAKKVSIESEHGPGGLVWFQYQEVGQWLYEAFIAAGLPAIYCPSETAKRGSNEKICDPKTRDHFVIASIQAHGEGKNLQFHQHALFVQWPRDSKDAEQATGRIHRRGQNADEVWIDTNDTLEFDKLNRCACLVDALYHQQTTKVRQKVIYGCYIPLPEIYPSGFLRERGFDNQVLDAKSEREFRERFGKR